MLDTTSPRSLLRAAIAERNLAAEAENNCARAVVRAKSIVDDAENMLAVLAGIDEEIVAHRANEIRAAAAGGERPTDVLPPHLTAKKGFQIEAEKKLEAARSAHELLSKELVAASGRCHREQENVRLAAGAVMTAEAEHLVEELWRVKQKVWSLSDRLDALGYVRVNPRQTVSMPAGAVDAINITRPPALALNAKKPLAIQRERWEKYLDALTRYPEALPESSLDSAG
jgi:hypothetical protein